MNIQRDYGGFYTLTFANKNWCLLENIRHDFNSVGCPIIKFSYNGDRYFIKYEKKEEAERALLKYGKFYNITVPPNRRYKNAYESHLHNKLKTSHNPTLENDEQEPKLKASQNPTLGDEEQQPKLKVLHSLILGNLPKNYAIEQVKYLIEEIQFNDITEIDETKLLKLKFCRINLYSDDDLKYLVKKLDGFILCGEKIIAIGEKDLLSYHNIFNEKLDGILPSTGS